MPERDYRLIPLHSRNRVVAHARVSAQDFPALSGRRWGLTNGYVTRKVTRKRRRATIYMHREILGLRSGDRRYVDHRSGDKLDNRRDNLRVCPRGQFENQQNRTTLNTNNTSGYRGVTWDKNRAKWAARVTIAGKMKHVGYFSEAAAAGAAAADYRRQHMPFATD